MKVRAKRLGLYNHKRRRVGDVFTISGPEKLSKVWMEVIEDKSSDQPEEVVSVQVEEESSDSDVI
jgi:hypothetical protein